MPKKSDFEEKPLGGGVQIVDSDGAFSLTVKVSAWDYDGLLDRELWSLPEAVAVLVGRPISTDYSRYGESIHRRCTALELEIQRAIAGGLLSLKKGEFLSSSDVMHWASQEGFDLSEMLQGFLTLQKARRGRPSLRKIIEEEIARRISAHETCEAWEDELKALRLFTEVHLQPYEIDSLKKILPLYQHSINYGKSKRI